MGATRSKGCRLRALCVPILLAVAAPAGAGTYLLLEDFDANDGGFVVVNGGSVEGPWVWDSGAGTWRTDGTENLGTPTFSELNSPAVTVVQDGPLLLTFDHRYSFEYDGTTRWDGGQVRLSLNGGAYQTVPGAGFLTNGYDGVITPGEGILNGQEGFNGDSAGYGAGAFLNSMVVLGIFQAGDQLSVQFIGAWDSLFKGSTPNWEINRVALCTPMYWTGAASSDWYDPGNWDPAGTPADDAFRVVGSGQPIASTALFARGGGWISISGSATSCTSPALYVGGTETAADGMGAVMVADGGLLAVGGTLKLWPGGTLDVVGGKVRIGGASDPAPGQLRIGPGGTLEIAGGKVTCGSFDYSAGGTFTFTGGTLTVNGGAFLPPAGHFTLDGPGNPSLTLASGSRANLSGTLSVGDAAGGTLTIAGRGTVTASWGFIGLWSGSTGAVTVRDPGSTWMSNGELNVGFSGSGTLTIAGGGTVTNAIGYIGRYANSHGTVTVRDPGSTWMSNGDLYVGSFGSGTLTIAGGGQVSNTYASIANQMNSTGTVTVAGAGSTWTSSAGLQVGLWGNGTLNIAGGGHVVSAPLAYIGTQAGSTGAVRVEGEGSKWTSGNLYVGGSNTAPGGTGQVTVADGGLLAVGGVLKLWPGGTLDVADGKVRIGSASDPDPGQLRIGPGGSLEIAGGQVTCGAFDNSAGGTFTFTGGTLTINGGAFVPPAGNFTLDGPNSPSLTLAGGSQAAISVTLTAGHSAKGTLNVVGGAHVSSRWARIGWEATSTGAVTVAGDGSSWTNSQGLDVGWEGSGTLEIAGGGAVSDAEARIGCYPGSTGTVMVRDPGSTWMNNWSLAVGCYGNGTLEITGGGAVSSTGGWIGDSADSTGAVTVRDPGSTWMNNWFLFVGSLGTGTLTVGAGGAVSNADAWIGYHPGSTGTVTVRDPGSTWTSNGEFQVGHSGTGRLEILGGASVASATAYVGFWSAGNGMVLVEGTGSRWGNSGDLLVGAHGTAAMTVRDGGWVASARGYVSGWQGSHATAVVEGSGSKWTNSGDFWVGHVVDGVGSLTIRGAGWVSDANGFVGDGVGAQGSVTVEGEGSRWTSSGSLYVGGSDTAAGGTGQVTVADGGLVEVGRMLKLWPGGSLTLGAGGTLANGGTIAADTLDATAGGAFSDTSSSMLLVNAMVGLGDAISLNGNLAVGHAGGSGSGSHAVGTGQALSIGMALSVGYDGNGTLEIVGGGDVSSGSGNIGCSPASNGTVTVDGSGSTWTNNGELRVGHYGSGTLEIAGGGSVSNEDGLIAYGQDSNGLVTVRDPGSTWMNNSCLCVGSLGRGTLTVAGGGSVSSTGGWIGELADSTGAVTVRDPGSRWTSTQELHVGYYGSGTLEIAGGGAVSDAEARIGCYPGSTGTVMVRDPGSTWMNNWSLAVGHYGSGTLEITGGGAVSSTGGWIGVSADSTGAVTVRDTGSTWENSGDLLVGYLGNGTVEISGGGAVSNTTGLIGYWAGSRGTVTVRDPGSTWMNNRFLFVGPLSTGTLTIAGGGAVSSTGGWIGYYPGSTGTVTVRDPGSTWMNTGEFHVGHYGRGTLEILGGASVASATAYVGYWPGGNGTVLVEGTGSRWSNSGDLLVGAHGTAAMTVRDGGWVASARGYVSGWQGSHATAVVEGPGSKWTNSGDFWVGHVVDGVGSLTIRSGGWVSDANGFVGDGAGAQGSVTVEGAGSTWRNTGSLYVGGSDTAVGGTGQVAVADGGLVEVGRTLKLWDAGTVDLNGGTIRFAQADPLKLAGGAFHLNFGTVEFDRDMTIGGGNATLAALFGSPMAIPPAKELGITGQATLMVPVTLDGGTFRVGSLINPALLRFRSGTFRLTGANLAVGPGGLFGARLALGEDQRMEVVHDAEVSPGAELALQGGALAAGRLTNHGLIAGRGRIEGPLTNGPGSRLVVGPGQQLTVTGDTVNDGGEITLGGGTLWFQRSLANAAGGLVMGNGMLLADGGITNAATMAFSGLANVVGDVTNQAGARIIASGGGPTTFFDDVASDGEIRISAGATAVFFGSYAGAGSFPGPGTACFEGDLKPGSSPGIVAFGGHVAFGPAARLEIELGACDNSDPLAPRYDCLAIAGDVALGGMLVLNWLPVAGDPASRFGGAYDILTYRGELNGNFAAVAGNIGRPYVKSINLAADLGGGWRAVRVELYDLLDGDCNLDGRVGRDDLLAMKGSFGSGGADWLSGDLNFDGQVDALDYLAYKDNYGRSVPGAAGAIPEPATLALLALGGLALMRRGRRAGDGPASRGSIPSST